MVGVPLVVLVADVSVLVPGAPGLNGPSTLLMVFSIVGPFGIDSEWVGMLFLPPSSEPVAPVGVGVVPEVPVVAGFCFFRILLLV